MRKRKPCWKIYKNGVTHFLMLTKYKEMFFFILLLAGIINPNSISGEERYQQLVGVTDLRTTFSTGCHNLDELAAMAIQRNIDVLVVADHDRNSLEYGFLPLQNLLKYKISGPSVLSNGATNYLKAFDEIKRKYTDLIVIPAVESAPFYYWTGSFFSELQANKWENRIMVVGMTKPAHFEGLPNVNSSLSAKYIWKFFPKGIPFLVSMVLGMLLFFTKGIFKKLGILIVLLNFLLIINYYALRGSQFDQYHGDQGKAPWQETINYANKIGALTFWNRLELSTGLKKSGPINIRTNPHPEDLLETYGYTGFQAVYNNKTHVIDPGREWDIVLKQYIDGNRKRPPWSIGGNNYHCEGEHGKKLTDIMTVFLVKEKTRENVLHAMKNGKMYALQRSGSFRLSLDNFSVFDQESKNIAISGDKISTNNNPVVSFEISTIPERNKEIEIHLIRSGQLIKTFHGQTPFKMAYKDNYFRGGEKIYYRLKISRSSSEDHIISNPIFVRFPGKKSNMNSYNGKTKFIVMGEWGYLRAKPDENAKVLGFAETNEELKLLEITGERYKDKPWYRIEKIKGKQAFVWSGLVKKVLEREIKSFPENNENLFKKPVDEDKENNVTDNSEIINKEDKGEISTPEIEYNYALTLFNSRQYDEAVNRFVEFIEKYPEHSLGSNARYWLGESYYAKNNYKLASKHFYSVMSEHHNSDKVKKAILKRGFAMNKQQNWDTARRMFENVIENYPFSEEAETAKSELRKLAQMERELP